MTASKTADKPQVTLDLLIRANYPAIVVNSSEELRVRKLTRAVVKEQTFEDENGAIRSKACYAWTSSDGLTRLLGKTDTLQPVPVGEDTADPFAALKTLKTWGDFTNEPTVFLFMDLHGFLQDPRIVRQLRDLVTLFQSQPHTLILLSPYFPTPDDMRKDVVTLDWPLPDEAELGAIVDRAAKAMKADASKKIKVDVDPRTRELLVSGLKGLSQFEAASVLSMAAVTNLALDARALPLIMREKKAIIANVVGLEFIEAALTIQDIGGLAGLKNYTAEVMLAQTKAAEEFGLDRPSGVFIVGVAGAGKSMLSKVLGAGVLGTVRLDLSALKGGIVGATEQNTIAALKVIDALGDVIVWLDEVEKALGDVSGRSLDGGASVGQFGILLTWMQERRERGSGAYIVATSNGVEGIPPEFLRRFDDIFFVDTPTQAERVEILGIHVKRFGRSPASFDLARVSQAADGYTGDELRKVVRGALNRAFKEGAREMTTTDLIDAAGRVIPITRTDPDAIARLRKWATNRARSAHLPNGEPYTPGKAATATKAKAEAQEDDD